MERAMGAAKRPFIGVTAGTLQGDGPPAFGMSAAYVAALEAAGAVTVLLPPQEPGLAPQTLARLDGLLLAGGGDLDPSLYGEEPLPGLGRLDPPRDAWEMALCRGALAYGLPLLAICRGIQVLNVAAGGSLYQDIPSQLPGSWKHSQDAPRWHPTHEVQVTPGSRLAALVGEGPCRVNTFHHQAVKAVAPGFRPVAVARDGVVEALEGPGDGFCLGVQWHPEGMAARDERTRRLFAGFVAAARF